jgi:superfamily II DNA/RNA helicase
MSFSELGLSAKVQAAVGAAGYTIPTPIQEQAIPHVLARRDVLGIAQTGTGKTAAFTLPMLTMLEEGRARARMPRTLILEPTRELAAQVEDNFIKYGVNHKLSVALLIGGVSFGDQDAKLTRGVDVLIATPGRLLDHFERGRLLLTGVELLVIDEADRMLDMGFIPDIERICKMVPFTRQTLFFTATMPPEIQRITEQFLHNPVKVEVARPASTASTITQKLVRSGRKDFEKRDMLRALIRGADNLKNAIIFCNRKSEVATVYKSLQKHEFSVAALHGDMDQRARMAALAAFRDGQTQLLVASDVAARGLDIPDVSHVFNYDTPHHAEDYVHRIGRTGRAGRLGTAVTIVTSDDVKSLSAIEKLIGQTIAWDGDAVGADEATDGRRERRSGTNGRSPRSGSSRGEARSSEDRPARRSEPRSSEERPARRSEPRSSEDRPARRSEPRAAEALSPEPRAASRSERPARSVDAPRPAAANRAPRPAPAGEEADMSHLPQFLLRPVTYKAK